MGAELGGKWSGRRFLLGPWRWFIVLYTYDAERDEVFILTFQDGRAARLR